MPFEAIRIETVFGPVHCSRVDALTIYRVGYKPDPWHWTPWEFGDEHGRFTGRWDDLAGVWRTLLPTGGVGACLLSRGACSFSRRSPEVGAGGARTRDQQIMRAGS